MKTGPFRYLVQVNVTFTAREIIALYGASQSHYDWKCKAASRARQPGQSHGGEIWGLINSLPGRPEPVAGESNDDFVKRFCSANPEALAEMEFTPGSLGTLGKVAEMPGMDPEEDKTLFGIRLGIRKVLLACNNEYTRLNCSPED